MSCPIDRFEAGELLTSLVDKSLVVFEDSTGRYRLLETVRQYARERLLESGEGMTWRDKHLAHFLALSEEAEPHLTGSDQQTWLERLEAEHDNLRAALEWSSDGRKADDRCERGLRLAGSLWRFWHVRGYFVEGRRWLTGPLDAVDLPARAKALNGAGALAYQQGDYPAARALHEESLAIRRELGDRRGIAASLNNLGLVAYEQGDDPVARSLYEESLAIRRELGDRGGIAMSLNSLGSVACEQGDYPAARALHEESLAIRRELGDRGGIALSLNSLGSVACEQEDYPAARPLHEESLAIRRELGDRGGIAASLEGLAPALAAIEIPDRAARLWGYAERLREEIGSPLPPRQRPRYERQVAAARSAMDNDAAFAAAWQEGRALSMDQTIELALEEPDL